jgi:UPF0755 protein
MDGFKRPKRPTLPQQASNRVLPRPSTLDEARLPAVGSPDRQTDWGEDALLAEHSEMPPTIEVVKQPSRRRTWFLRLFAIVIGALLVLGLAMFVWYQQGISAKNSSDTTDYKVVINPGASVGYVAKSLESRGIIKNKLAFELYARLSGKATSLKEGTCKVKASQSASEILDILSKGCNEFKIVTFFPGATIEQPLYKPAHAELDKTMYIKYRLSQAGYSNDEITAALGQEYAGPLFAGKPADAGLEGYIYGETYYVDVDASAQKVLQTTFDQMYADMKKNNLPTLYAKQNLTMYQAITLASIVQRELNCEGKPTAERKERCYQYQRTIAQIFLKRLKEGISLGSDVTFIYAADMRGVAPTVDIDSPYNTRIHTGLPPGPIASPGLLALRAVANPSDTNYLFFIAGDDGLIYFAKDQAGHEENIKNHCQKLCNEL